MNRNQLITSIRHKESCLCVGLDTDPVKLPNGLGDDPDGMFKFNKAIIEATSELAVAYKLNLAFYEAAGEQGWIQFRKTVDLLNRLGLFVIADAKRGDIGNTAAQYAKTFYETYDCDAVTVNPYMGTDAITPFIQYNGKWVITLGLTSNAGAADIQMLQTASGEPVFAEAMRKLVRIGSPDNHMFVVGATQEAYFHQIRSIAPEHFMLVPGIGAQGGRIEALAQLANRHTGLLVNASRSIIYASNGSDYAECANLSARKIRDELRPLIR
ncbi:MAG: orotidine-5'-phosphate decarboxylase [Salibacteraceae bacterium]